MGRRNLIARLVVQTIAWLGLMGAMLFLAAGNWRWMQAWAFLAIFAVGAVAFCVWLLPRDPELLASRLGPSCSAASQERLLERDLPGYAEYMTRVRYRLVPGVW